MTSAYSPFSPGRPVDPEYFVGRTREIEHLLQRVEESFHRRRIQVVFLYGERGIGKSSLSGYLAALAEEKHQAIAVQTNLGRVKSLDETVRLVFERLINRKEFNNWLRTLKGGLRNAVEEIDLFGLKVSFKPPAGAVRQLVEHFPYQLKEAFGKAAGGHRGVLLILDDINGLAANEEFANWLKGVVDDVSVNRIDLPACILLVGYDERRQQLIRLQPSLARVLDAVEMKTWSDEEARDFFAGAFRSVDREIEEPALGAVVRASGGFPVLAHEIGEAVFYAGDAPTIELRQALDGVYNAAEVVGKKIRRYEHHAVGKKCGLSDDPEADFRLGSREVRRSPASRARVAPPGGAEKSRRQLPQTHA
ncbi:MAG: ATP-binding protein [Deltaproteobacteria bacterium]|nr:ATP-binding protein [Deltaproteobacteria bacterium]